MDPLCRSGRQAADVGFSGDLLLRQQRAVEALNKRVADLQVDDPPGSFQDHPGEDVSSLQQYAARLAEVVSRQQLARREDMLTWRDREQALISEVAAAEREARRACEERDRYRIVEVRMAEELKAERRGRIRLEAQLVGSDRWRAEAEACDRATRAARGQVAFAHEAEAAEAREWKLAVHRAREGEARALTMERSERDAVLRARQELIKSQRAMERGAAETELRAEAGEAQALSAAWRLTGELRSELDDLRGASARLKAETVPSAGGGGLFDLLDRNHDGVISRDEFRRGVAPIAAASTTRQPSASAARAMEELRGARQKVNGLLSSLPP
mmetsp:Transcript_21794/g.49619  ORF Transcript_21794/g.49619 Transcript_21794/m.49619 type:complete len:330 (-) Transcript_21794:3-992(-)